MLRPTLSSNVVCRLVSTIPSLESLRQVNPRKLRKNKSVTMEDGKNTQEFGLKMSWQRTDNKYVDEKIVVNNCLGETDCEDVNCSQCFRLPTL